MIIRPSRGAAEYTIAAYNAPSRIKNRCDFVCPGVDDHLKIQEAIDELDSLGGGILKFSPGLFNPGTVTWKNSVSLEGNMRHTKWRVKDGAGNGIISEDFATKQGSGLAFDGLAHSYIGGFLFDGGSQPASGATDYEDMHAILKIYGWDLNLENLRFDSAAELALYTEHDDDWTDDGTFDTWELGENRYSNIKIRNYGKVGWLNRGSHDSKLREIIIASSDSAGVNPDYGYIQESNGGANYGAHGSEGDVHVWGNHNQAAIYLNGSNIINGFLYAEGTNGSAIRLNNSSANRFRAFVGFCNDAVELIGASNGNEIEVVAESNISGALFQVNTSASNNILKQGPGYGSPSGAVFDLTNGGTYTGSRNHFIPWHGYTGTIFAGTPNILDSYDAPASHRTGIAKITSGGASQYAVPGATFSGVGTSALSAGAVRYTPFLVERPITITAQQFEVTTGPASGANVRVGIYQADMENQPVGAALYDSGNISVASGFTGLKTATGLSVKLKPGLYLLATNCDVAMTLRTLISPAFHLGASLGGAPMIRRFDATQTYGAFPNPGTKWTSAITSSTGFDYHAAFQFSEYA